MINLSQFDEAEIVAKHFGSFVGHFVDIGAGNGVALSNTFQLGLAGWRGLLVEASPTSFAELVDNYANRGYIHLVNAALWTERKLMRFHYNPTYYSSLIEQDVPGRYDAHYWVQTVTAVHLAAIQPECDFCSVDIEGADILVFPSLIAAYPNCQLWCVEHGNKPLLRIDWKEMFDKYGLKIVADTPENYICAP